MSSPQNIMIVSGEASGDLHGANLVKALKKIRPQLNFCGMGGRAMAEEGVEILHDAAGMAVVGIVEIFSHLGEILKARKTLLSRLRTDPPDLLVLIDYPDFNLLLAAKAKKLGIPIFYYISPQVWAWRSGRVAKIGKLTDRIGVILPFEKDFFRKRGVEVDFVGHPLMDSVATTMPSKEFLAKYSIPSSQTVIGLLPGSRTKEVSALLPIFLEAAKILDRTSNRELCFLIPRASTITREFLEQHGVEEYSKLLNLRIIEHNRYDIMAACKAAVTASGTVTLELAILNIPMITTYKISPKTYLLGRLLVKLDHFSLVNLVARKEVIPELLQHEVTAENIATHLSSLLKDEKIRSEMLAGLTETRERLGQPGASRRAAEICLELLDRR